MVGYVQAVCNITYSTGNALHSECAAFGTCQALLGQVVADAFNRAEIILGEFRYSPQGLNWNVGVFQAGKDYFGAIYKEYRFALKNKMFAFTVSGGLTLDTFASSMRATLPLEI